MVGEGQGKSGGGIHRLGGVRNSGGGGGSPSGGGGGRIFGGGGGGRRIFGGGGILVAAVTYQGGQSGQVQGVFSSNQKKCILLFLE